MFTKVFSWTLKLFVISTLCILVVSTGLPGPYPGNDVRAGDIEASDNEKSSLGAATLILPVPVWIVGTYDSEGVPNVMTASWAGICNSSPPCVTISLTEGRYSYGNIIERKAFTINIPSEKFAAESAFFGTVSGRDFNKFDKTGLTAIKSDLVDAPYIREFPLVAECRLIHTYKVGSHVMLIGEILDIKADKSILKENGRPDIDLLKPFIYATGSGTFHGMGKNLGLVRELQETIER
ncbi:MAG: flavin reductase family protein [Bacteroidales bacterium]|nr:flavin reductase family protein [Candidatus Latescibacterota bacterium]